MSKPQVITTECGERLVVLTEREYDAMLARAGNSAAEDRAAERMVREAREAISRGAELVLPGWFAEAAAAGNGSMIRGLRKYRNKTQEEVATAAHITQGYFSDVERGAKVPTVEVLDAISRALDLDPAWLRALERTRAIGA
jgi:DNA-binding XRE family transcriptional regulator